jgi:ABC-type nitrate/sulfonate/bicarbonate transport system substrate-binding protein
MNHEIDRRAFLRRGGVTGLSLAAMGAGLPTLLAACGSSSSSSGGSTGTSAASGTSAATGTSAASGTSGSPMTTTKMPAAGSLGTISVQLSWIENAEFSGEYIAATKGYYTDAGFKEVKLISGGPAVAQDAVVAAGKAFVGISSPDITGPAVAKGAPLVIVGAQYQKNPFAIMSLASSPLKDPQAMIGKTVGVQSTNLAVWKSFLAANHIDPSKINIYPAQFDPSPLAEHKCDGWFSFITNEPIELAAQGVKTHTFLLNDYHYPLVSETYMVNKSTLASSQGRAQLKGFLLAEVKGWRDSLKNPAAGPTLSVDKFGKSLGNKIPEQTKESKAQNELILDSRTAVQGIITISPAQIAENVKTLTGAGSKISASLFDTSIIDEVFAENPDLKASPV